MPIIDLQRRVHEAGRIRIGQTVPDAKSKTGTRPAKLDTFRFTSPNRQRIEQVAERYGGEVKPWKAPAGDQFEVITKADNLDVIVPPTDLGFSQYLELWSAGGCQRRCDGVTELLTEAPCLCEAAIQAGTASERACDYHTRLSVLLGDLPGMGTWRLDTQGYYAAGEMNGAFALIQAAAGRGALLPARLRLEQRSVKRGGQTRRFAVPVLDIEISPAQLLSGGATPLQLADTPAPLTPVPQLPAGSGPTIAEQSQPPQPRPRRRNAAPEIPASGRTRRTAGNDESPAGGDGDARGDIPEQTVATRTAPPAAIEQPEPSPPSTAKADEGSVQEVGRSSTPSPCEHPDDERVETKSGTVVCGVCGERITQQAAAAADEPAHQPKTAEDPDYWTARVHAAGGEKGLDHDDLRLIAAALKRIPPDAIADWSMTSLAESDWEGLDKLIRRLPATLDLDAATLWIWPIAEKRGLADWDAIDTLATAAYGKAPDELTVAEWIAWGLRCYAGEYDAQPAQARPRGDL